jgi:periplasmic divalent cation tolerance protein
MSRIINVQTTVDSKKQGERLVEAVLEEELAAWGTVNGPVTSIYLEDGDAKTTQEWICTFWTREALYEQIERMIMKNHPYEEPTVASLPVLDSNNSFTEWIEEETAD